MNIPNKEDVLKKWAPILDNMGITGSQANWMSEYAEMHSKNETTISNTTSEDFQTLLPTAMKISAQTVGLDLVATKPMSSPDGTSEETMQRIKAEVKTENRERKINNLLDGEEYEEMYITEHSDYNGPVGNLFYFDFKYGGTQSNITI
jgi:hypothetical protein